MKYSATIHSPGCLPEAEPVEFDTAQEAWEYLYDDREVDQDQIWAVGESAQEEQSILESDTTLDTLRRRASDKWLVCDFERVGSVWGPTPGHTANDPWDRGLVYSVDPIEEG